MTTVILFGLSGVIMRLCVLTQCGAVAQWLSINFDLQSLANEFEPRWGTITFLSLDKILNSQLPHSTQVYKSVHVLGMCEDSGEVLMQAGIHTTTKEGCWL